MVLTCEEFFRTLESQTSVIAKHFTQGNMQALKPGQYHVILGADLARYLRVSLNDHVTALSAQGMTTPAGLIPKMRRLKVVGLFKTGLSQFDRYVALAHIDDVRKLVRIPKEYVSGLHLRVDDLYDSPAITKYLSHQLGMEYFVSDWTETHKNFFRALEMEKLLLLIIMMLIVIVAMFNIVSMLVMVVMEKRNDIAILTHHRYVAKSDYADIYYARVLARHIGQCTRSAGRYCAGDQFRINRSSD